jgi:putative radical SAM enzyme (TIGR03279 family)
MLYGSFVTLTNLSEADWERIEEQRVSPMHVSVHAMNPELRVALVGNPKGGQISEDLARLERAGIDFHAQLVLCPGVNDGDELDRSVRELAAFRRCLSIAGVPVGLTKHGLERQSKQMRLSRTCMRLLPGKQISVRRYEQDEAEAVIEQAERWQAQFRRERGETFFHLGDEFYLMTGREVPSPEIYDGFPQIEDGIGITRHFIEDLTTYLSRSKREGLAGVRATLACGTLIGPTMHQQVERFNRHTGADVEVAVIENGYFGPEINISGLLTGSDLIRALPRNGTTSPLYISSRMISDRTHTLLDDITLSDLSAQLGRPVVPAYALSDVGRDLRQRSRLRRAA